MKRSFWSCLLAALLLPAAAVAQDFWPCSAPAGMDLQLEGDDILVTHANAVYNCCTDVSYALTQEGQSLILQETEVVTGGLCDCVCCYQLAARIADVPPGAWTVVLRGEGFEFRQDIVVPGAKASGPWLRSYGRSRCGGTEIVGIDEPVTTWGALKSAYR